MYCHLGRSGRYGSVACSAGFQWNSAGDGSYTFRNFERAQVIAWMKQLRLNSLNCKDVKDHLPSTSIEAEQQAIEDYKAAAIKLTAAGNIAFAKDEDADVRG